MRANGSPMKIKPQAAADRPSNRSATPSATWPKPTPHAAANATSDEWVHRILRRITKPPATVELRKAAVITLSSLHQVPGKTPIHQHREAVRRTAAQMAVTTMAPSATARQHRLDVTVRYLIPASFCHIGAHQAHAGRSICAALFETGRRK